MLDWPMSSPQMTRMFGRSWALAGAGLSQPMLVSTHANATALSGVTWGKLADSSSRKALAVSGLCAGLIGCLTATLSGIELEETASLWFFGILFFLLGLAHTGIRIGRKTWIVDHADADNRARLVAVSNTLMGVVLLVSGAFGLLAEAVGEGLVILVFALLGISQGP